MFRRKTFLTVVLVCIAAVVPAVASNVGFKFVPAIGSSDPDVFDISLPYFNNYTTNASIFDDINTSPGCDALQVTTFFADQSSCSWTGPWSCNKPYTVGDGIRISVAAPGCTWVIAGSSDPSFSFAFTAAQVDPKIRFVSLPYHNTYLYLSDVFNDLPNAAQVTRFHPDQTSCSYTGPTSCDEAIERQDALVISVLAAGSWTPKHY
jgi:hypothetical protein